MTVVSRQFKQAKNESASNHSLRNTVLNVGKSMKGSARGNWDPREGQQPFPPNPKRGTTKLKRLLIGTFINVYTPLFALADGWQNRLLLSLCSSLLQKSLHSWGLQLPSPRLGLKRCFQPQRGRKYLTGSSLLTSSPSMTLTHPLFYIVPLAVAPLLTSPLLPPFLFLGGASGHGF